MLLTARLVSFASSMVSLVAAALLVACASRPAEHGVNADAGSADTAPVVATDFIPIANLPPGFSHLATHDTTFEFGLRSTYDGTEGVYRNSVGEDVYVQVMPNRDPGAILDEYKALYTDANYDPFADLIVNGHPTLRVLRYPVIDGMQQERYSLWWINGAFLVTVGATHDPESVLALATATGH